MTISAGFVLELAGFNVVIDLDCAHVTDSEQAKDMDRSLDSSSSLGFLSFPCLFTITITVAITAIEMTTVAERTVAQMQPRLKILNFTHSYFFVLDIGPPQQTLLIATGIASCLASSQYCFYYN